MITDTQKPIQLVGFDSASDVFLNHNRVIRGIYQGKGRLFLTVLNICEKNDLFKLSIVATRELKSNPFPDSPYDLVLEHEKIPFITYPHEWSTSMLKDAAIFHIDLYTKLGLHDLTIKDWHPLNILFKGTEPVFVDFTSIIPIDNLQDEEYLTPPHIPAPFQHVWDTTSAYFYEMYQRMFVPYFLLPLYLMHQKRYNDAKLRMFQTTLNTSSTVINNREVFRWLSFTRIIYDIRSLLKKLALIDKQQQKPRFLKMLRSEIEGLNISPMTSAYTSYYDEKKEKFSFDPNSKWTNKQTIVDNAIKQLKPKTVLDVACNTGWFAILAAHHGCQVIAFDIDEASINMLYDIAKREKLQIIPLVMDFTNLTPDVFPMKYENKQRHNLVTNDVPLLLSAEKRLKCDMVLALAIIHHLVLGLNLSFAQISQNLSALTEKQLVLEFVSKYDKMIVMERDFFPALKSHPDKFDWYTQENLIIELKKHFQKVHIEKSSPNSRMILICSK